MEQLAGKVAVVTGAGSGIGRATAVALAQEGMAVAVCDIDERAAEDTAAAVGGGASAHRVDVASQAEMRQLVEKVLTQHHAVDLVVNNAGVGMMATGSLDFPLEQFHHVMDVNFWGVVHGSVFFLPHLMSRPEANLVNVASWGALLAPARLAAYNASKFAVRGFTETLRMELQGSSVHVTLVFPGATRTQIFTHSPAIDEETGRRMQARFETLWGAADPARVASSIVAGIKRNRPRVLAGPDTKVMDVVARAVPGAHSRLLSWPMAKLLEVIFGKN